MKFFEKYLSAWVIGCILLGITLGNFFPLFFKLIASLEIAHINFVIALLIWIMIIPMMMKINFQSLKNLKSHSKGIFITLFINWIAKPLSMLFFGTLFLKYLFVGFLPHQEFQNYIAGLIILAAAPCTAMVFVWSRLTNGNPNFTLVQVAINDLLMLIFFIPIVRFLLQVSDISIPFNTIFLALLFYVILPLAVGQFLRASFIKREGIYNSLLSVGNYASMIALLTTLTILFALQGTSIIKQPLIILLIAIPIIFQVFAMGFLAYFLNFYLKEKHEIAAPSALIGASNFFELAVAVCISLFGIHSHAALATVVGVLIEVPVMLILVNLINKNKNWYNKHILNK